MYDIRCMTILHSLLNTTKRRNLGPRSNNQPLRMSSKVIGDGITVVHLAQEFTAKHDLSVLSVEVCDLCFDLVSYLLAIFDIPRESERTEVLH